MPRLYHDRPFDVFNPQLHITVAAGQKAEVTSSDADLVNTTTGIWHVEYGKRVVPEADRPASRKTGKRGAAVVEQSGPPPMETR